MEKKEKSDINALDKQGGTALIRAINSLDFEKAEKLIETGADVNEKNGRNGQTPLAAAAANFSYETVEYLINHGAKPEIQDMWKLSRELLLFPL